MDKIKNIIGKNFYSSQCYLSKTEHDHTLHGNKILRKFEENDELICSFEISQDSFTKYVFTFSYKGQPITLHINNAHMKDNIIKIRLIRPIKGLKENCQIELEDRTDESEEEYKTLLKASQKYDLLFCV